MSIDKINGTFITRHGTLLQYNIILRSIIPWLDWILFWQQINYFRCVCNTTLILEWPVDCMGTSFSLLVTSTSHCVTAEQPEARMTYATKTMTSSCDGSCRTYANWNARVATTVSATSSHWLPWGIPCVYSFMNLIKQEWMITCNL